MTDLRYPIGQFEYKGIATSEERQRFIADIAEAPERLAAAVAGLNEDQLNTPYRPEGWTIRQVAHHIPDSHLNSYTRFRIALTEDYPTIRPYREDRWAELSDARNAPVEYSVELLKQIHRRWVYLLKSLTETDWLTEFQHPDLGAVTLDKNLALYSWHGRHHVAQITSLRSRLHW